MDSNVLAALISAGVSFGITIIYWLGKQGYTLWQRRKIFKSYKNYAKDCLEQLLYYYKHKKIAHWDEKDKYYKWEDLKWTFIVKEGNRTEDIADDFMPSLIISFIAERELWTNKEAELLLKVLGNMCPEKWLSGAKLTEPGGKKIEFSGIVIDEKDNKNISEIDTNYYCFIAEHCATRDFCEKILSKLNHGEYDARIKKIINRNT